MLQACTAQPRWWLACQPWWGGVRTRLIQLGGSNCSACCMCTCQPLKRGAGREHPATNPGLGKTQCLCKGWSGLQVQVNFELAIRPLRGNTSMTPAPPSPGRAHLPWQRGTCQALGTVDAGASLDRAGTQAPPWPPCRAGWRVHKPARSAWTPVQASQTVVRFVQLGLNSARQPTSCPWQGEWWRSCVRELRCGAKLLSNVNEAAVRHATPHVCNPFPAQPAIRSRSTGLHDMSS